MHNAIFRNLSFDFTSTFRYCLRTWPPTKVTLRRVDLTPLFSPMFLSSAQLSHSLSLAFHRNGSYQVHQRLPSVTASSIFCPQSNVFTAEHSVLLETHCTQASRTSQFLKCSQRHNFLPSSLQFTSLALVWECPGLCSETNFSVSPPCEGHRVISCRCQCRLQSFCFSQLASQLQNYIWNCPLGILIGNRSKANLYLPWDLPQSSSHSTSGLIFLFYGLSLSLVHSLQIQRLSNAAKHWKILSGPDGRNAIYFSW